MILEDSSLNIFYEQIGILIAHLAYNMNSIPQFFIYKDFNFHEHIGLVVRMLVSCYRG